MRETKDNKASESTEKPDNSRAGKKPGGPRTVLGKEKSKHNARTHGIFSKIIVLEGESQAEYAALLHGLREASRPKGTLEEGLVETLAVTWWRQRRLLIAEGAEIEAGRASIEWNERQRERVEAGNFPISGSGPELISKAALHD